MINFPSSYQQALIASSEASKVIIEFYEKGFSSEVKSDGSPVTEADLASSKVIHHYLKETQIPILGEESVHPDFEIRKNWKKNWCVDPLDGTKEFIKKNGEFVVCIALIENNKSIFGVIASPTENKIVFGGEGIGAYTCDFSDIHLENKWIKLSPKKHKNDPVVVIGSRSYHTPASKEFMDELNSNNSNVFFRQKGSAMKFFDLALGEADIYPRFAPTMDWDIAAGHAILRELGGEVYDMDLQTPLVYNKENLLNPHFIAKTKPML